MLRFTLIFKRYITKTFTNFVSTKTIYNYEKSAYLTIG